MANLGAINLKFFFGVKLPNWKNCTPWELSTLDAVPEAALKGKAQSLQIG